ncbi:hypothetical protein [Agrococcus sp. DT81.2]|uniref:hypothetical protein n=1 Tax=Agrococcus sp. DT81.2 TaxID=3393414 RepID=UPI003CE5B2C5
MPHLANGKYVSQADAIRQWAPAAREVLIESARKYGGWITCQQLSDRIQASTGITTDQIVAHWIGRVLGAVAAGSEQRGEPRLTSVCVTPDRLIGEGYPGVPAGTDARTRERVAAEDRLECYRFFGATMPTDGGTPTVLAPASARPDRPARSRVAPAPAAPAAAMRERTCPHCFMVVPVATTCRDCGGTLAA